MNPSNDRIDFRAQLKNISLDLNTFAARLHFENKETPLEIHFDKPSRRFYFSLVCLVVTEMKKSDTPDFIYIRKHENTLKLLDNSLAGENASKTVNGMWDKIRKAWRHRLPDLETGSLFTVLNRDQLAPYEKGGKFRYDCSEAECDAWANLFSYDETNTWRLKFATDSADTDLKNVSVIFGDLQDEAAWQEFTNGLKTQPKADGSQIPAAPLRWKRVASAFAIVVSVVLLTVGIWYSQTSHIEPAANQNDSNVASLAILPFLNMSGDPQQEYFSDGITDDLITDISKISYIYVISRNSTFTYKGKTAKVQEIGKDLDVRYILEGSVRKVGDKIRINAQLIDTTTGHHMWAERYDGNLGDIFELQDRITQKIVAALSIKLTETDLYHLSHRETANFEAYEAYLQGWEHQRRDTKSDLAEAVASFKTAIELDPKYSEAHAALSLAYQHINGRRWDVDLGWGDVRSLAQQHLDIAMLDPTPLAHRMKSRALLFYGHKHEEAIAEAERALALNPNDPDNLFYLARALSFSGRHIESLEYYKKAMRVNPHYPSWYPQHLGVALYCLERYEEASKMQERASRVNPNASAWWTAAAYAQLGQDDKAADVLREYIEKRGWHICYAESTFKYWPFKDQKDLDRFAEGLVKAGLPRPENPAYRRKYSEAIAQAEQAVASRPEDAIAQRTIAESLTLAGRAEEAMEFVNIAIKLEPDNSLLLYTLGLAQFCSGQYAAAERSLEAFSAKNKHHIPGWLFAATYGLLDQQDKAEKVLAEYLNEHRLKEFTVERVMNTYLYAFKDPGVIQKFAEGLQKAGLPNEKEINSGE